MFRAGNLRCVAVILTAVGPCSSLPRQMRCLHLHPGLATRSLGALSATAQLSGGGKQNQQSQQPALAKSTGSGSKSVWPRKIFSGIQPTGTLHLGNYLGAVRRWVRLQNAHDDVTVCIVDMHSITMPHNPPQLRENILIMGATLLACGIDPTKSTFFVQSGIPELAEFNWILTSLSAMPRLAQLPQFREKSRLVKDIPLGLYAYPVLQAADIMLYKATHVPVGADQLQHIKLAQHLARTYNSRYGETFPVCEAIVEDGEASRILSLRDPGQKMSKSNDNLQAIIYLTDSPELITKKISTAATDFTADVSYHPGRRPGVSNLVNIHSQVTGQTIKSVVDEASTLDTAKYKERVAEAVIEHLRPIREMIHHHLTKRNEIIYLLEVGATKARQQAQNTLSEVKQRLGLGASVHMPAAVQLPPLPSSEVSKTSASRLMSNGGDVNAYQRHKRMYGFGDTPNAGAEDTAAEEPLPEMAQPRVRRMVRRQPMVPAQSLRVEKQLGSTRSRHVFKMDCGNAPHIGFKLPPKSMGVTVRQTRDNYPKAKPLPDSLSSFKQGQNAIPSAVSMIAREVNTPRKQEFSCNLNNSGFYEPPLKEEAKASDVILLGYEKRPKVAEERDEESEEEWENGERSIPEQTKA